MQSKIKISSASMHFVTSFLPTKSLWLEVSQLYKIAKYIKESRGGTLHLFFFTVEAAKIAQAFPVLILSIVQYKAMGFSTVKIPVSLAVGSLTFGGTWTVPRKEYS